jgi:hypothetical protein
MDPASTAASYRARYALYLSANFNISPEKALADVESVLAPKKPTHVCEEEVRLFGGREN